MIEFHAGNGPDTQAVGVALEEMLLDYRVMPGRARLPVISLAGARVVGAGNILMALARKTGRYLPRGDVAAWLDGKAIDREALETLLAGQAFVAGEFSVADMAVYPQLVREGGATGASITRWMADMAKRPATGRGMGVVVI